MQRVEDGTAIVHQRRLLVGNISTAFARVPRGDITLDSVEETDQEVLLHMFEAMQVMIRDGTLQGIVQGSTVS